MANADYSIDTELPVWKFLLQKQEQGNAVPERHDGNADNDQAGAMCGGAGARGSS
jgi:hypothetical protein